MTRMPIIVVVKYDDCKYQSKTAYVYVRAHEADAISLLCVRTFYRCTQRGDGKENNKKNYDNNYCNNKKLN